MAELDIKQIVLSKKDLEFEEMNQTLTPKTLEEAHEALVRNFGQPWVDIHPPRHDDD